MSVDKPKPRRKYRILGWAIAILAVLLLIAYLAVGAVAANRLTIAQRFYTDETPMTYQMDYQEVSFPAAIDGLEIAAWYIPAEPEDTGQNDQALADQAAIVMVHGWNASRTQAFARHFLELARDLHQAGFALLTIDLRGHGQSADSRFTFGRF